MPFKQRTAKMLQESAFRKPENIKVFIRIKPSTSPEASGTLSVLNDDSIQVSKNEHRKTFRFTKVFAEDVSQLEIYKTVGSPLVDQALNGYNATIFAYGQSGSGKTFTILGDTDSLEYRGIVPNVFSHILTQISLADSNTSYLVTVTFLEIYNEEVRDLLNNTGRKLEVRESPEIGVYVKDLTGITVESTDQVFDIITKASKNRITGSTNLNAQSSRSHAVFTVLIEARHEDNSTTLGKLHLVDLAGSERVSKSLASGDRLKEAGKINLSLSVLGNVISALIDGNASHIPYRNSKLTRLLQDSLGGSSLTSMIATVSAHKEHFDETCYTLMYADRAKQIRNHIKKNVENNSVLRSFEQKIEMLRKQLEQLETKPSAGKPDKRTNKLEAIEDEKKQLLEKLAVLQKKVLVGGENLLEKAQLQMQLLDHSAKELTILDSSHQLLQETLHSKKEECSRVERSSLSLQEEDKLLDFQISEAEKKITKAEKLLFKKEAEYQNEISNLLYTNKCLAKDLGLANYLIKKSIPREDLMRIKDNIFWDGDIQDYRLNSIAYCGNNLKKISLDVGKGPRVSLPMRREYRKYSKKS